MRPNSILGAGAPPPLILGITVVFVTLELALTASDSGFLPLQGLRYFTYTLFGFYDQIFEAVQDGATPPFWFWTSFVTYAFLHGGMFHLIMNSLLFIGLGGIIMPILGPLRFMALFFVTAIGGSLGLAFLSEAQGPLVGASGVVFGLIGALKAWELRYILLTGTPWIRFWRTILVLAAMNLLLAFIMPGEGSLAWQAHLGGFVAGFAVAPLLAPRLAAPSPI